MPYIKRANKSNFLIMKFTSGHYVCGTILLLISITSILSCVNVSTDSNGYDFPNESKHIQLSLIDSLGTVSFSVPIRYDTSFHWIHYSDCGKPCDVQKYRYQSTALPSIKENGWISSVPKDSVDRLTISHTLFFPFHDGDTAKNEHRMTALKQRLTDEPFSPPIVFDTIEKINDRYCYIVVMETSDSIQSKKVVAMTTIKNNEITFSYELKTATIDTIARNFITNSIDLIRTIRMQKGV